MATVEISTSAENRDDNPAPWQKQAYVIVSAQPRRPAASYAGTVQVQISPEAAAFVRTNGGELWIWAARARMCCAGAPALMHTAFSQPDGRTGFAAVEIAGDAAPAGATAGIRLQFRPLGGMSPQVLEIGMHGRRRPKIEAYWDGCRMAMT